MSTPSGADPVVDAVLAHDALVTALPFVVPALIVVLLMAAVIWRDRRSDPAAHEEPTAVTAADG